jgi:hypothetical protein
MGLLMGLLPLAARADVDSGPTPGEKVPPLKVLSVVGEEENENKEIDAAKLRGKMPTLYLFVRADRLTRPIARTMKTLDQEVDKLGGDIKLVAVWLTDEKEKTKEFLPKAQQSLKLDATTLALYPELTTGPEHWGINSDADLTVVVTSGEKVTARFGFVAPNERVAREVLAALKKVLKKQ